MALYDRLKDEYKEVLENSDMPATSRTAIKGMKQAQFEIEPSLDVIASTLSCLDKQYTFNEWFDLFNKG